MLEGRHLDEGMPGPVLRRLMRAFQDVDLCLRLGENGYRIVYTPYAELYHHESASKTESEKIANLSEINHMKTRWAHSIANDPYYSPNLTLQTESFDLRLDIAQ